MTLLVADDFNSPPGGVNGPIVTGPVPNSPVFISPTAGGNPPQPLFSNVSPIEGAFSCQCYGDFGIPGQGSFLQYQFVANTVRAFGQKYFRMPTVVTSGYINMQFRSLTNQIVASAKVNDDFSFSLKDGTTTRGADTIQVPPGSLVRVELYAEPTLSCQLRIFYGSNVNGSIPDDVIDGDNTATPATNIRNLYVGCVNGGPPEMQDRIRVDDTSYPAPLADQHVVWNYGVKIG